VALGDPEEEGEGWLVPLTVVDREPVGEAVAVDSASGAPSA
jgi:hypothetical protein